MIVRTNWDTSTNKDVFKTLVRKWFDSTDREALVEYPQMMKTLTTNDEYERHGRYAGLDYPGELDEGENIPIQDPTAIARNPDKVIGQSIDCMGATSCLHGADYIMTRARGPLRGPHSAGHASRSLFPPCGGPAFLPAASGGVSSRRIS